eukprot:scaffold67181_cov33-Phaeocystis_antarctica.AAC.2
MDAELMEQASQPYSPMYYMEQVSSGMDAHYSEYWLRACFQEHAQQLLCARRSRAPARPQAAAAAPSITGAATPCTPVCDRRHPDCNRMCMYRAPAGRRRAVGRVDLALSGAAAGGQQALRPRHARHLRRPPRLRQPGRGQARRAAEHGAWLLATGLPRAHRMWKTAALRLRPLRPPA